MKEVKRIKADGTINMVCGFVNELSAREIMKTFIILHYFTLGMYWMKACEQKRTH